MAASRMNMTWETHVSKSNLQNYISILIVSDQIDEMLLVIRMPHISPIIYATGESCFRLYRIIKGAQYPLQKIIDLVNNAANTAC